MVPITHFSHEHPLILLKQLPAGKKKSVCYGCRQLLTQEQQDSDVYGCEICETFFLHKSCAELPMEIVHKSHEKHFLSLLSKWPGYYRPSFRCHLCKLVGSTRFLYHCSLCDFYLDVRCATEKKESLVHVRKDLILYHPSHKHHPLTLIPRPTSFQCDACDVEDTDFSYHCSSCNYLIHRRCAILPSMTNNDVHTHPLSLSFDLPSQYHTFLYSCAGCGLRISPSDKLWLYYCERCRYFVHIKCMAIKKSEVKVDLTGLPIDKLPCFPMSDKSEELIHRFLLNRNNLSNVQYEISRPSHKHPLFYSDEQILDYEIEDGEEVLCDGCIEPIISPPYYHCAECRYFLHLPCAELPNKFRHPSHGHPLILTNNSRFCDKLKCHDCFKESNGFFFRCTFKGCNIYLDVKCAALGNVLKHESHNHPLFIDGHPHFKTCIWSYSFNCRCCGMMGGNIFGCEPCSFFMHRECLMLPKTTKHKFDSKHQIRLRWPPHDYHPTPFACAECEKEIDPNFCLYHCQECDLSIHVRCINLSWEENNSKFGQKLRIVSHPHHLKYVYKASVRCPCHSCGSDICDYFCLECETCNFHLCESCVQKIQP